jgi:Tol biopolymer transport system component
VYNFERLKCNKTFSSKWQESLRTGYSDYIKKATQTPAGKELINKLNGGKMNVVPSISPDGKLVAFWSEKNLFSIDLFVADVETGKIIKKLTSNSFSTHIDEYSSYESSVAWSPDSKKVAFIAFAKGRNRLIIQDVATGKLLQQYDMPGVPSFSNPAWSPDGKTIVITGLVNGQSDLYAFDVNEKKVTQLTNDYYSDLQPSFSPDGKWIVFSTDRNSFANNVSISGYSHNIALLNVSTGIITNLGFFAGANNFNPVFGNDNTIYFLSDRDGFRNLYSYKIDSKELAQLTNLSTGITGITLYAPAISVSATTGNLVYTYYSNNNYLVYKASVEKDFERKAVNANDINRAAAMIPPFNRSGVDIVKRGLDANPSTLADTAFKPKPYSPKFELDYLGSSGAGISTSRFGTGVAGGVNAIFSDMLGYNQLYSAIALNGEIYDVSGSFAFINQKRRVNWGASVSHIPYLSGSYGQSIERVRLRTGDSIPAIKSSTYLVRTF